MNKLAADVRVLAERMTGADAELLQNAAAEIEGGAEAFGVVVDQKRELEKELKRVRELLRGAYDMIARNAKNGGA